MENLFLRSKQEHFFATGNFGVKKKRSYTRRSTKNESDDTAKPSKRGRKPKNPPNSKMAITPKKQEEVSPKHNRSSVITTLEEALSAYADFYKKEKKDAILENYTNKASSLNRIVKRFEHAIEQHRLGEPVDVEKLPVPPGYPPFPELHWEECMTSKSASRSTSENSKRKPYQRSSENFTNKKMKPHTTER